MSISNSKINLDNLDFNFDNFQAGQRQSDSFISPSIQFPLTKKINSSSNIDFGEIKVRVLEIESAETQALNVLDSNEFELRLTFNAQISQEQDVFQIEAYPDERNVDARAWLIADGSSIANIARNIENNTLIYDQEEQTLTVNFLDLLDEFSSASRFPLVRDEYYMILEGIPLSDGLGNEIDTVEAIVSLI